MPEFFNFERIENDISLISMQDVTTENAEQVAAELDEILAQNPDFDEIILKGDFTNAVRTKEIFDVIKKYPSAKRISMEMCNIGDGGIANIIDLIGFVTSLNLRNTDLEDEEISLITEALKTSRTLIEI